MPLLQSASRSSAFHPSSPFMDHHQLASHQQRAAWQIRTLFRDGTRLHFANREPVYLAGDTDPYVYLVEAGQVKTIAATAGGKRCLLSLHTVNEAFGEAALLGGSRMDSAEVCGRAVVRRLHRDRFMAGLDEENLLERFLVQLSTRMLHQQSVIVDMVTMDSERRLAACLLALARDQGVRQNGGVRIKARMTQQELAEMVGTTRSRIGLFLKNFRQAGMVSGAGTSLLVDPERLASYLSGVEA